MSVSTEGMPQLRLRLAAPNLRNAGESWTGPLWVWGILIAVLLYGLLAIPEFFVWGNLSTMLAQAVPLGLVAIGETLVILTGGIDISVATVVSMGNTLSMGLMNGHESHVWYGLLLPLLAGIAIGVVNGIVIAYGRVPAFIATLGSAAIVQGIVFAYTHYNTYGTAPMSVSNIGFAQ